MTAGKASAEQRIAVLEAEVGRLRAEVGRLRARSAVFMDTAERMCDAAGMKFDDQPQQAVAAGQAAPARKRVRSGRDRHGLHAVSPG